MLLLFFGVSNVCFFNHFPPFDKADIYNNIVNAKNFSAGYQMFPMNVSRDFIIVPGYYYYFYFYFSLSPPHKFITLTTPTGYLEGVASNEYRTSWGMSEWDGTLCAEGYAGWNYRESNFNSTVPGKVFTPGWRSVWRSLHCLKELSAS